MKHLLNGKLFSWLKEGAQEMADEQIEMMVLEFVDDLVKWSEGVRDYGEVARGLESIYIRLQVWNEVYQAGDGAEKKHSGRLVPACRVEAGEARDPVGAGTIGEPGVVYKASG